MRLQASAQAVCRFRIKRNEFNLETEGCGFSAAHIDRFVARRSLLAREGTGVCDLPHGRGRLEHAAALL